MANPPVTRVEGGNGPEPIVWIARADAARAALVAPAELALDPDLQPVPRPLAPQGLAAVVDRALGPVDLPRLLDLAEALEAARIAAAPSTFEIDPALADVVDAVLADEAAKVMRYLDLRGA